jgi:hypothetical protein
MRPPEGKPQGFDFDKKADGADLFSCAKKTQDGFFEASN